MTTRKTPSAAGQTAYAARRRALFGHMKRLRLDAMVITRPADVSYITGFNGDDGSVLMGKGWAVFVVGDLYGEQARKECSELDIRIGGLTAHIAAVLKGRRVRRLGMQDGHLTTRRWRQLAETVGSRRLVPADGLVKQLRLTKDADELAAITRAVHAAEKAFNVLFHRGRKAFVGRTERQVAAELDYQMVMAGADRPAFPTIVAAGEGGSQPHYQPGNSKIRSGQPVLIDWGARVAGYCSDLTRVIFMDTIPPEIARIYEVVAAAHTAGINAIWPGIMAKSADLAARRIIEQNGCSDHFIHGLGHGLGLEIHEEPALTSRNEQRLCRNMVITVEPGIYLPGIGGVRIEDDVAVTAEGGRRLSSLPTDIKKMVLR